MKIKALSRSHRSVSTVLRPTTKDETLARVDVGLGPMADKDVPRRSGAPIHKCIRPLRFNQRRPSGRTQGAPDEPSAPHGAETAATQPGQNTKRWSTLRRTKSNGTQAVQAAARNINTLERPDATRGSHAEGLSLTLQYHREASPDPGLLEPVGGQPRPNLEVLDAGPRSRRGGNLRPNRRQGSQHRALRRSVAYLLYRPRLEQILPRLRRGSQSRRPESCAAS